MTESNYGYEQMAWFDMLLDNIRPWAEVHKPFAVTPRGQRGKGSRLIKCECLSCGFVMRTTRKHIDANNAKYGGDGHILVCPTCVLYADPMVVYE